MKTIPLAPQSKIPETRPQPLETHASSLRRMTTLLHVAGGAWTLGLYESGAVRRSVQAELHVALDPLPVYAISLLHEERDLLTLLDELPSDYVAPLVTFYPLPPQERLMALCRNLDLQRESLARTPHSLCFWVNACERRFLAQNAPNFYSRLSGVFDFPGAGYP